MAFTLSSSYCIALSILLIACAVVIVPSHGVTVSELLLAVKAKLQNTEELSSWNPSTTPCSGRKANWKGVLCNNEGLITGLQLENMGLKGVIDVDSLRGLPNLRTISFMNNELDGPMPQINKLTGFRSVFLSNNKFSDVLPDNAFQGMVWLKKIHLSNNQFTGPIPEASLLKLPRLIELQLDGNQFTGPVPNLPHTSLTSVNFANNKLQGPIPDSMSKMPATSFSGNEELCGPPLGECKNQNQNQDQNQIQIQKQKNDEKRKHTTMSIVVVVIAVLVALIVIGVVIFILLHRRRQAREEEEEESTMESQEISAPQLRKGKSKEFGSGVRSRSLRSVSSTHSCRRTDYMKLSFIRDDRERFELHDLLRASAEILGSGCFSSSYRATLPKGQMIVVKRYKQMNNLARDEFHEHMRRIGRLNHPNLLPLVAYYYRREEKLFVTDLVKNGSLAVRLHGYQALGLASLDWGARLKIVKGITKGLQYLYKDLPSLIAPHGNLKSCNILLTESLEPLLCDYGLIPLINQELAKDVLVVYNSPEYLKNGRITKKSDVWCLGILILEILTGKFPADSLQQGKGSEMNLANWVLSVDPEKRVDEVFDKELMGAMKSSEGEMVRLLNVAMACCEENVEKRWELKEAVEKIEEIREKDQDDDFFTVASDADVGFARGLSGELNI
ncbi:actin-regulating kinase prk1 [Stylosanthes scabra]|uniref:Actin-regulating kinase prk1 n=1 Tax=Stylosanthes scabra TaxID=79078 RepID=A0ABU6UH44_9FABA|nr:actin-regulating kinase prk1 [Stylosanthes scabra]